MTGNLNLIQPALSTIHKTLLVLALLFLASPRLLAGRWAETMIPERPNILLIITDQHTADALSCAGNDHLKTPALDRLAASGVRFDQSYVTQPLCLPFRSSLQTSRYPHEIGTVSNSREIQGDFPLLGNLVADAGYDCAYYGKWHVGTTPGRAGYEVYDKAGRDHEKSEAAVQYLMGDPREPFFLTVSFTNPHNVCQLARADADGSDLPDGAIAPAPVDLNRLPPLPDNFEVPEHEPSVIREIQEKSTFHYPTAGWDELTWRQYLWGYYRLVEKVDAEIGKVLNALTAGGHEGNTVIIFTSDHGEGVAMHRWNQKQILYDQATRVPLIISWPNSQMTNVSDALVSNALDIPVTILDLIGADVPPSMHGLSLVPILEQRSYRGREYVVSETMFARGAKNLGATGRMLRSRKYKYCIYDSGDNREQLFDMEQDPGETINLAVDSAHNETLRQYRKLIARWASKTNDDEFPYATNTVK